MNESEIREWTRALCDAVGSGAHRFPDDLSNQSGRGCGSCEKIRRAYDGLLAPFVEARDRDAEERAKHRALERAVMIVEIRLADVAHLLATALRGAQTAATPSLEITQWRPAALDALLERIKDDAERSRAALADLDRIKAGAVERISMACDALYDPLLCSDRDCACHTVDSARVTTPFPFERGNPYCCSRCALSRPSTPPLPTEGDSR